MRVYTRNGRMLLVGVAVLVAFLILTGLFLVPSQYGFGGW